jgi:branched-chain amino acid aminotransferase
MVGKGDWSSAEFDGLDEGLQTSERFEYFEESGTMNVMFRKGNTIMTPQLSESILNGITRDSILKDARDWGYEVVEKRIAVTELIEGLRSGEINEAFGAGTAATIAPIRTICLDGEDFNLNEYSTWEFAPKVAMYLDRVKRGRENDTHNWNHVV